MRLLCRPEARGRALLVCELAFGEHEQRCNVRRRRLPPRAGNQPTCPDQLVVDIGLVHYAPPSVLRRWDVVRHAPLLKTLDADVDIGVFCSLEVLQAQCPLREWLLAVGAVVFRSM